MRVRGRAGAGMTCRLCGRHIMEHGVAEFCKDGLTKTTTAKDILHEKNAEDEKALALPERPL